MEGERKRSVRHEFWSRHLARCPSLRQRHLWRVVQIDSGRVGEASFEPEIEFILRRREQPENVGKARTLHVGDEEIAESAFENEPALRKVFYSGRAVALWWRATRSLDCLLPPSSVLEDIYTTRRCRLTQVRRSKARLLPARSLPEPAVRMVVGLDDHEASAC
jgi:hypothetical protein